MVAGRANDWRPSASIERLRQRALMLSAIRAFFAAREVLEVETPVLGSAGTVDPNIESFVTEYHGPGGPRTLYLQTSPEFHMKRLLAAGSGPIYQISRVFRQGEAGRCHNPEFTLLEWYRPGFDHHQLMCEVDDLLRTLLAPWGALGPSEYLSYAEAFQHHAGFDPHRCQTAELAEHASTAGIVVPHAQTLDRDAWLDLIMSHQVQPKLGAGKLSFVHDYPASQAALALVRPGAVPLAERFEVFLSGHELGNGFHELRDGLEQGRRFSQDLAVRRAHGQCEPRLDDRLLHALAHGLPPCAGVALGLDRLLFAATATGDIADAMAFAIDRS